MIEPSPTKIGFIGTGVMGASMAGHLQGAGYELHVHNRTKAKAAKLLDAGAVWEATPGDVAAGCDVTFTIVGFPPDVEAIFLSESGLIASAKPGSILVDMTTSRPDLAMKIAEAGKSKGVEVLDAPVSGGDVGARNGTLSIMVGGNRDTFESLHGHFALMGANVVYQGAAGSGQHTKMCNQIAIAGSMLGMCEALAYAHSSGLDPETVLQSITKGAAGSWSLDNLAPRILQGDYDPGFYIKHYIKDLGIALETAKAMDLKMPALESATKLYDRLADEGFGDCGTQALCEAYFKQ
ncbi:MAG: NAD-binding protein [Verrucomicrobia bacterium]|jgi:3-hydroxyisobutyrate dehydrogenase|nr:NAD-binding protein [Verrucomicrobiota bacterium]